VSPAELDQPHHDGSSFYVDGPEPALGSVVGVRVRVPHASAASAGVWVRSVRDGEPSLTEAVQESADDSGTWWRAALPVHNPVTSYRFLLGNRGGSYRWLNGSGVHTRDVTDAADYRISTEHRLPDWVLDQVGYQIFPDRFARGGEPPEAPPWARPAAWDDPVVHRGPDVPHQWYGGTLDGIREHLAHLTDLGVSLLYLTPFFEARSNHRYDAASFDRVDPVLGGAAALARLIAATHDVGLRLIGDLTTNHTGDHHPWFRAAVADPGSAERDFYRFRDGGGYESWMGVPSLPKLDHASAELRRRLYDGAGSVVARWMDAGMDGWRIDVANMTGRLGADDHAHEVARTIRRTIASAHPDGWLLAEHGHDATLDLDGRGWHGTMDYAGFTRPVWAWLNGGGPQGPGLPHDLTFLGLPTGIPVQGASASVATMREVHAAIPWASWVASTSHLDSHDTPRFRTVAGGGTSGWVDTDGTGRDRHLLGVALQMTLPGIPVVFMGDELGLTGVDGEHARTPMPWHRTDAWDKPTLEAYRTWIAIRRGNVALRRGGLRWMHVGKETMTFLREHHEQRILVHLARSGHSAVRLPRTALGIPTAAQLVPVIGEPAVDAGHGQVTLPSEGPAAHVYVLDA